MVAGLYANEKPSTKSFFLLVLQTDDPNFYTVQKRPSIIDKSFTKIRDSLDSTQLKLFIFLQSLVVAISAPPLFPPRPHDTR